MTQGRLAAGENKEVAAVWAQVGDWGGGEEEGCRPAGAAAVSGAEVRAGPGCMEAAVELGPSAAEYERREGAGPSLEPLSPPFPAFLGTL